MKKLLYVCLLSFSFSIFGQNTQSGVGAYETRMDSPPHLIVYTLNLNPDGAFDFHSHNDIQLSPDNKRREITDLYGRGTWVFDKNQVVFTTSPESLNEQFTLDFTSSKARFVTKHPRDKSDRVIKTHLQFYQSPIFWIERIVMNKL